ncbi:unnamed protein product [Ophioblennius macclurei]
MPDHKLQPGGKLSRDPSPRPAMTTHLERQRDGEQEEKRRRENNPDIMRDKTRQRGMETMGGYYKRDVVPAPRPREEERDYREFRRHDDRRKNGRLQSNFEESEPPIESGRRKGDTFPRMKKGADHDRRIISTTERGDRRERDRPQRAETDKWEREYERTWQRDKYTERERAEFRGRHKEGGKSTGRRPVGDEHLHRRERYQDYDNVFQGPRGEMIESRHDGERHTARKREKLKADTSDREARVPSPRRRRDEGMHTGGREREKTHRRDGKRDTRSEGDSLERELSRETAKNRERERCAYSYSKSEGDIEEDFTGGAGRHRQASREQDGQRNRGREGDTSRRKGKEGRYREDERRAARPSDREGDRWRERDFRDDRGLPNDRRDDDRYRKRRERERDVNYRRDDVMGQSSRPPKESSSSRTSPQTQSSGEWSSDMDSDVRYKRGRNRDSYETESRREGERRGEKATDLQKGAERGEKWHPRGEKQPRDRAEIAYNNPEQRRMWLDPGRDKTSKEDFVDKERREKERSMGSQAERERVQEEPNDTRKTEGGSQGEMGEILRESDKRAKEYLPDSDGGMKESWQRDAERESVTDNTEESDREKDRSGDEAYIGKSDEDEYKDCQESWSDHSPVGSKGYEGDEQGTEWSMTREEYVDEDEEEQERENRKKLVFCVIGNTLPRSGVEQNNPKPGDYHRYSDEAKQQSDDDVEQEQETLTRGELPEGHSEYSPELRGTNITEEMRSKVDAPRGSMNRDSQTERLLKEWQERNKELGELQTSQVSSNPYPDVHSQMKEQIQPILDQISSGAMSPEEVEAIRIRLSGAWAMCDESKRRSQAPHLKWAKDVVREILGHSDERLEDETNTAAREDQGINPSENKDNKQDEVAQVTEEQPVPKVTADDQQSEPELEELMEGTRGMGQSQAFMHADRFTAMHVVTATHTHADTLSHTEREEDDGKDKRTARPGRDQSEEEEVEERMGEDGSKEGEFTEIEESREEEVQTFLSVNKPLYKPNSCPILNYQSESELLSPSREGDSKEGEFALDDGEEEQQGEYGDRDAEQAGERVTVEEKSEVDKGEGKEASDSKGGTLTNSCSFRDLGAEARIRRRGIRKTTERRNGELSQVEEEGGRDRRTRIFSTSDDDDDRSKSWEEVELRNVLDSINRQKRNSRFFNAAQLYQQYNEEAQNFEILRQSRSDVVSANEDNAASPAPSPPPARRPLPALPVVQLPHTFSKTGSITSIQSLPLPVPPREGGRPSSPRLSVSLTQSPSLWRDLPGVRNSTELDDLSEDQRRLQEVRFEVVTSEASYCRSLDIVVEYFVKSKQLGSILSNQQKNCLFSRLTDVRAISHSFLAKLEQRVESDMMHFTVCDIIAQNCPRFKMVYVPYLTNQSYQDTAYQKLMNENPEFKRIVEKLERSPVCQRLPLRSFLVLPFQRITRIKLLVQNIVKRTTPGTPEAVHAIKALKLLEKLIQESNDSITQMKSIEALVSLSGKVDFACRTLPLIGPSRWLVREGPATELMDFSRKETERNVYMHLFNDYLLLSLQKEGGRFTVIDHAPVSDLRVENCRVKLHSLKKNLFRLHMSKKALLLRTDVQSDKLRWISALSRPHPEIDFSAAQDFEQMQCIRAFVAQQPDELSLEKADVILVHQQSTENGGEAEKEKEWVEGTKLSDRHRGWVPKSHLETISNSRVRQRNLSDALKLTTATAAV